MDALKQDLARFQQLLDHNATGEETRKLLSKLKIGLIEVNLPSLSEIKQGDVNATLYRMRISFLVRSFSRAGDILEAVVLYSLKADEKSFERYYAQLKPFYFEYRCASESDGE